MSSSWVLLGALVYGHGVECDLSRLTFPQHELVLNLQDYANQTLELVIEGTPLSYAGYTGTTEYPAVLKYIALACSWRKSEALISLCAMYYIHTTIRQDLGMLECALYTLTSHLRWRRDYDEILRELDRCLFQPLIHGV